MLLDHAYVRALSNSGSNDSGNSLSSEHCRSVVHCTVACCFFHLHRMHHVCTYIRTYVHMYVRTYVIHGRYDHCHKRFIGHAVLIVCRMGCPWTIEHTNL